MTVRRQESEALNPLTGGRDIAGYVGASTQQHEVVYGLDPLLADFDGTAILSKFPVLEKSSWPLYHYAPFPVFTLTEVKVLLAPPATTLTLINVHPTYVDCRRFRTRIATYYPYHQVEGPCKSYQYFHMFPIIVCRYTPTDMIEEAARPDQNPRPALCGAHS